VGSIAAVALIGLMVFFWIRRKPRLRRFDTLDSTMLVTQEQGIIGDYTS
jgi:hypothetical protein